jgi:hypothetical protein
MIHAISFYHNLQADTQHKYNTNHISLELNMH